MRILQIIQKKQLRGAEVFTAQLSAHMVNAGHEVLIVSLGDGDALLPFTGDIHVLHANFKKKFFDWGAWKRLATVIKEFNPDIVQANAGDTLKYAVISKTIFRWKQPVIFRNASMVSSYIHGKITKMITAWLFANVSHIISVSAFTKNDLVQYFGLDSTGITVLPVGIELQPFSTLEKFEKGLINLVHVGGFSFEKNHERMLVMFRKLWESDNRFRLWLIGDGPLRERIRKQAAELGVEEYVYFEGFNKNPLNYISSANMLLLPSKIEGLPAVILEAFYCKVPVVAYNAGGISELVINEKTGWLINVDDEAGFISAVQQITVMEKTRLQPVVENAYHKVISGYTNKHIAESFIDVYKKQL